MPGYGRLILIAGLPGSGKTTLLKGLRASKYPSIASQLKLGNPSQWTYLHQNCPWPRNGADRVIKHYDLFYDLLKWAR